MHSMASWATSMLTAALTLALVPAGLTWPMRSLAARATEGASNGSSGIQAIRCGAGGRVWAVVAGGLCAQPPRQIRTIGASSRITPPGDAHRSVESDIAHCDQSGTLGASLSAIR